MKQRIKSMKSSGEPVTALDLIFTAIYNVLYEKHLQEPEKGIVVAKGTPQQRRATWSELLKLAHTLEDFFTFRDMRTGHKSCNTCTHWKPISKESPHMGECTRRGIRPVHAWSCCKKHSGVTDNG